jgi:hypothetical protein
MKKGWQVIMPLLAMLWLTKANAQDESKRKTIDITSSFKPVLRPQNKIGFTASAAITDSARPVLNYQIPSQNLALNFSPAALRPMEYQQDSTSLPVDPSVYLKLGYGNFSTPYVKGLASFGDGVKSNANVEAGYIGSKGKIPFQQFNQYHVKGNLWLHMKNNAAFHLNGGYQGFGTYQYGFDPKGAQVSGDSLKLNYNLAELGAALASPILTETGVAYNARINGHYFSDNRNGQETAFRFEVPLSMKISDVASFGVGIKGMLSSFSGSDTSFSNNLFMIPVWARFKIQENIFLRAGLIPSWNNSTFKLLPDIDAEYLMKDNNMVLQAGLKGYFDENTYRSLTAFNPWINQPSAITNSRVTEFYAALKSNVSDNLSYRIKAGYGKMTNLPLFVNDSKDGRSFNLIWEPELTRVSLTGELTYKRGDQLNWSNALTVNGYSQLESAAKPYGLLPFEFRSSVQWQVLKGLRVKSDLYLLNGAWYRTPQGDVQKGKAVFDLNAGVEFAVHSRIRLWLQFNNIANMEYQRWNQYRVLGFQALGGVIFQL